MALAKFTRKELETRNTRENAIVIIDNVVYDVTKFMLDHPGGHTVLLDVAGKDASKCFHEVGHSDVAYDWRQSFVLGEVVDEDKWEVIPREVASPMPDEPDPMSLSSIISVWGPPAALALLSTVVYVYMFP